MQLTINTINDDLLVLFYDVIFFFVTNFHANSSSLANCDEYENLVTENIYSVTIATSVTRKSSQMITSLLVMSPARDPYKSTPCVFSLTLVRESKVSHQYKIAKVRWMII